MVNLVVDSAFILAKVELPITAQQNHVNKSKLPGAGSVKVDMDILMQRCEKNRKQKQKEKPEAPKKENMRSWSWDKLDSRLGTSSSEELPSNNAAVGPITEVKFSGGFDDALAEVGASPATTQIVSITFHLYCLHVSISEIVIRLVDNLVMCCFLSCNQILAFFSCCMLLFT